MPHAIRLHRIHHFIVIVMPALEVLNLHGRPRKVAGRTWMGRRKAEQEEEFPYENC